MVVEKLSQAVGIARWVSEAVGIVAMVLEAVLSRSQGRRSR